ncbi:uncharacterized protein LOC128683643 [Plodia interpunctella]|uniref:uncharacterized protein LOC128683643 n=1 Tax=Plodia interpunctella TaxID=58824 RepID=UPI002367DDF8|nr:uncharacterized protein LOC128683643 [Plodia interpunctella]
METSNKSRTPSRCREWERQRRNKFNDAIAKLGEIVKSIIKSNDTTIKDAENIQYPKIEIIQKAISCLSNCLQEKTQMKTEILALQVKLDAYENKKNNVSDASTQVFCIGINRKKQNKKPGKLITLQKSKCNALKEKSILTTNVKVKSNATESILKESTQRVSIQKLPILLPNLNKDKKGPDNTIVVLPAAPYIFQQRPMLFPALPPTIVLVDQNLQPISKTPIPIVNRSSSDITKTTMVNILPISAYSRPLSATKTKKSNLKSKTDSIKKISKKSKSGFKINKEIVAKDVNVFDMSKETIKNDKNDDKNDNTNKANLSENNNLIIEDISDIEAPVKEDTGSKDVIKTKLGPSSNIAINISVNVKVTEGGDNINVTEIPKCSVQDITTTVASVLSTATEKTSTVTQSICSKANPSTKFNKVSSEKDSVVEDKDKENKLPTILDSALCDTVVDAGNARLELAEEFLAASPTAAFLMSFPLVSGNRADSPAEDPQNTLHSNLKENTPRRIETTQQSVSFYEKPTSTDMKKQINKVPPQSNSTNKQNVQTKESGNKSTGASANPSVSNDNPFLNLHMSSLISTNCTISDTNFGLDFDCNINKTIPNTSTNYATSGNFFYKSDPFSTVKSTIYSTSSISSGHEFNTLGLYPCAMEKYTNKNKADYTTVEDNLMKIGSSRLTYDIDLGWSHKGFDFVGCTTTANTFNKDNILTTVSSSYSNSYPFNSEFHIPLVANSNKKENVYNKPSSSFTDTINNFYSQPTSLWPDDAPFYTTNSISKSTKQNNYLHLDHISANTTQKSNNRHYNAKMIPESGVEGGAKSNTANTGAQVSEKYTKKSPSKMHINWMTSEIRPMQNNYISNHTILKESQKTYGQTVQTEAVTKKLEHSESNFFPLAMHSFSSQNTLEELQAWPTTRPVGPTEISIEPPPINLPTLVGDLALGPHDKKKHSDLSSRGVPSQADAQNCGNFLSVTQIMNRSSENMASRYQAPNADPPKVIQNKQTTSHFTNDSSRKTMHTRLDNQPAQPCYVFNEPKVDNSYENMTQYAHNKSKSNKTDKNTKTQKNNYSAEALIRGGSCSQRVHDNSIKFITSAQKYNNFNSTQDNTIAQVSHFPPILDYSDNSYTGQQFSGTTLYNTTNTISNSFYSNFMPGSSNLMSGNYTGGPFPGDFMDYNQTECNYTNHKYEELKMRNNVPGFPQDKPPSTFKSSRRDPAAKHKIECSKKDSNKKYQSKRTKVNESEEWNEQSHILWQNKSASKRHTHLATMAEELPFPNYVSNQMPGQYQPDLFNSHLMPANVQSVGHNVDRSLSGFPVTSRANFNLSTIFPEITMKVQ